MKFWRRGLGCLEEIPASSITPGEGRYHGLESSYRLKMNQMTFPEVVVTLSLDPINEVGWCPLSYC